MITEILFAALVGFLIFRKFLPSPKITPQGKAVLVTGCDTGFGHELAKQLHRLGFVVFAGCLDATEGEGASQLRDAHSERGGGASGSLHVIQMDVTNQEQVSNAVETVSCQLPESTGLWAVVNNAGISTFGDAEFCGMDVYQRLANVNLWGPIRVCKAFLPMLRKNKGRVINVTSIFGRQAFLGRSCYVSTKFALEGFTQCLRYEMRNWGVSAIVVEPGNYVTATQILSVDKVDKMANDMLKNMSEEVREAYGEDFFKARVQGVRGYSKISDARTEPVVNAMVAAVTDKFPRIRYEPKSMYWHIRTFVMTILPHQVGDYIYC